MTKTATIALTEVELEILLQALSARDTQLRYHTSETDLRRIALPTVQAIKGKAGDALMALFASRRAAA
jgi:hypothetical protein